MRLPELAVVVVVLLATVAEAAPPAALVLERVVPLRGALLEELREFDRSRHAKMNVVNLTVEGDASLFADALYYTTVKLGTPPQKYTFQIDTGSSIPWVACKGCARCSTKNVSMGIYSPDSSSTSSRIACSDDTCEAARKTGFTVCRTSNAPSGLCGYNMTYADETIASGNFVSDIMYFDTIMGSHQRSANNSATVVFGCTDSLSQSMKTDGLLGFGRKPLSIISQLNSQGVSPEVFSQCLKGSEQGGGILVLGKIEAPGLVYTPLVSSTASYNLNLESIAVNGQQLPIDSSLFATSSSQGTVLDSGTTLTYLVDGAYGPLVSAIVAATSSSVRYVDADWNGKGNKCFLCSSSIDLLFPRVTLHFQGGAAMIVEPSQYLVQQGTDGNDVWWCIGWQSSQALHDIQGITLLGDIVLRDRMIVYDLRKKRARHSVRLM